LLHLKEKNITKIKASLFKKRLESSELAETISVDFCATRVLLLDDMYLVVAGARPEVSLWNIKTKQKIKKLIGHRMVVSALVKLNHNELLASGSADTTIKIWNCTNSRLLKNLTGHVQAVNDLVYLKDKHLLISSSDEERLIIWNVTAGEVLNTLLCRFHAHVTCLSLFKSKLLASGDLYGYIFIWKAETWENLQFFYESGYVSFLSFLSNGNLALCDQSAVVKIRNVTTGFLVNSLTDHSTQQVFYFIELKNSYLASASIDGTIKIWNYTSGERVKTLKGHSNKVNCLCLIKNDTLLSSSADRTLKIWKLTHVLKNFSTNQTTNIEYGNKKNYFFIF
jgi:WD40 repeat protein